jgi:GT2 family glycosyltransferase
VEEVASVFDGYRWQKLIAVLTLTSGRDAELANLIAGLDAGEQAPDVLVVVDMGGDARIPPTRRFGVEPVALDGGDDLPLARARNVAARATRAERLIFLDVDCIPARNMVAGYDAALSEFPGIVMGGVRYLRRGAQPRPGADAALRAASDPHPVRPQPTTGVSPTERYELLWSLSFGVGRAAWARVGGFDPGYRGYGAEDTDFAFAARAAGVPLAWAGGAECFHQHHPQCRPPLDRVDAVVRNALRFRSRWGEWPMGGWLAQLAGIGIVAWESDGERLEVLRRPTAHELARARAA